MIAIFKRIPNKEIKKQGKELVVQVTEFFKNNPRRRVCNVAIWYNRQISIKKKTIKEQIEAAVAAAVK